MALLLLQKGHPSGLSWIMWASINKKAYQNSVSGMLMTSSGSSVTFDVGQRWN